MPNRAAGDGIRLGYITNNASRTDASVAEHLSSLGLTVAPEDVVTSPQAALRLLADRVPAGSTVLVVGGDGLVHELEKAGYVVTRSTEDHPAAVVQGFAPEVGWSQLAEAAFALEPGKRTGEPVQTQFGWHVIEVIDRRTAAPSFEETEPRLRQEVAREIVTALVADLRDDAAIERFDLDGSPMPDAPEAGPSEAEPEPEAD